MSYESCSTVFLVLCGLWHAVAVKTPNLEDNVPTTDPSHSSFQHAMTTVTMATHQPMHKSRSGLEEMESEGKTSSIAEEKNVFLIVFSFFKYGLWASWPLSRFFFFATEEPDDEDDDEENSEESVEEESDEDLTETPKTSSTQPPYSFIPPPPVWVQRNQGLSMATCFLNRWNISD